MSSISYIVFVVNLYLVVTFLKTHRWFRPIYNFFGNILGRMFNPRLVINEPVVPFEREE